VFIGLTEIRSEYDLLHLYFKDLVLIVK